MKKSELFFNVLRLPVDFVMLLIAGITTYLLRTQLLSAFRPVLFQFNLPLLRYTYIIFFVSVFFIGLYAISGLYSFKSRRGLFNELSRIIVASSAGIMVIIVYIFLRQELFNSRFLVLGGWLFAILFVFLGRVLVMALQRHLVSRFNFGIHRVLLIGNDVAVVHVRSDIENNPAQGYRIAAQIEEPNLQEVTDIKAKQTIDEILLTNSGYPSSQILELVDFCNEHHIIFKYSPNLYQTLTANFDVDMISGLPFIELKRTALDGWGKVFKRMIDIIGAVFGLVIFSPLFLITAIAIKLDTSGPVFARLKRVSKNKEFILYKFRGMISVDPDGGAESLKASLASMNERNDGPLFKIKNDPRITKVGRVIRKYRIDELAQFINVLKGDMSLVGPRPHQPDEIARYEKHHKKLLAIKAGATGLAQVSGSSDLPFEKEVALDTFYIENWSLLLDLRIILKTTFKMFTDRSAV